MGAFHSDYQIRRANFHGDVHYYYSGNAISAGLQRLLLDPLDNTTVSYVQIQNPSNQNEVGHRRRAFLEKQAVLLWPPHPGFSIVRTRISPMPALLR
jgi:hypothetical protein